MERVAHARRGADDRTAEEFSAAVRPHLRRLRRFIAARAPRILTEDVEQETLLRAFRSWPTYDRSRPLWPWLARIAHCACAAAWHADGRRRRSDSSATVATVASDSPGSDQHVAALHAEAVVAATLAELTDRERILLCRADGADMPRHVLARTVSLSPAAARVALHRARHRFREFAQSRWEDTGVASAFAISRLRLRWRTHAAEPLLPTLVLSASVLATLVATLSLPTVRQAEGAVRAGIPPTADASASTAPTTASGREPNVTPAPSVTAPPQARRLPGSSAPVPPMSSPPSPVPAPGARIDLGPDGLYGGVRVDFKLPTNGYVYADPHVGCRHSTTTQTACLVTGSLPSAGPVEFYGSGDGDP